MGKDDKDGGYASRKFWFSVGTSAAVVVCAALAARFPSFGGYLGTTDNALLWCLAIYAGGNVAAKGVLGKFGIGAAPAKDDGEDDKKGG